MNLTAYRTPGVYFEASDGRPQGLATVRVDVAGFVGIAARGPLRRPVRIESWAEFVKTFGSFIPEAYLAFAVDGFFANGGDACWVVRVADPFLARAATFNLLDQPDLTKGKPILQLEVKTLDGLFPNDPPTGLPNPGTWGNDLSIAVAHDGYRSSPDRATPSARFSLTLRLPDGTRESWRDLSLDQNDPRYVADVINDPNTGSRWITTTDPRPKHTTTPPTLIPSLPRFVDSFGVPRFLDSFGGGADGLAPANVVKDDSGRLALQIHAASPATAEATFEITPDGSVPGRFTIAVFEPGSAKLVETWSGLTLDRTDAAHNVETILNYGRSQDGKFVGSQYIRARNLLAPGDPAAKSVGLVHSPQVKLRGGLRPDLFGDIVPGAEASAIASASVGGMALEVRQGLEALGLIDEVRIVALPDLMPKPPAPKPQTRPARCTSTTSRAVVATPQAEMPRAFTTDEIEQIQREMIGQAERLGDRIALLDVPPGGEGTSPSTISSLVEVQGWRAQFNSSFATAYYPWIGVPDPFGDAGSLRLVPPCGHVAGIWANTDATIGPHASPANATIERVHDLPMAIDDEWHARLNDSGVNVIRDYAARGIRVMGARTFSTDLGVRFLAVRRLLILIERSIDVGSQWIPFESNDPDTWTHIDRVVRSFLDGLWRKGMLDGATAESAYFVACDASTNPPVEVDAGRLICMIGINPPWPAEFVVVKIGRTEGGTQILETQGSPRRG
jgi:phage tail sheath protein FI